MKYIKEHYDEFNNYYIKRKALEIDIDIDKIVEDKKKKSKMINDEKEEEEEEEDKYKENDILKNIDDSKKEEQKSNIEIIEIPDPKKNKEKKEKENVEKEEYEEEEEEKEEEEEVIIDKTEEEYQIENIQKIKIILLGEHYSGKTTIIHRYIYNTIPEEYHSTNKIKHIICPIINYNGTFLRLTFIDTPPIQKIKNKFNTILENINIALFVFDSSNKNAFQRLISYIEKIQFYEQTMVGIIANKQDLCPEYIKYKIYELKEYCYQNNMSFSILSARNKNEMIFDYLNYILSKIVKV